ncbi:17922_t:CDS:2 [Funneliformis geosporum]|uniref:17922_t:CDS:1 n=1 Tax=Funneliformis geosporum TaxID=1117311 RepID=A0A9W4X4L5_9GLOM|nr:17922_t:CDS:2 [Funneliformis geosporum]
MAVEAVNEPQKTLSNNMSVRKSKNIEQNSDALYDLVENLKATLKLLVDQESPKEKDEFGQPLILEVGLCSLVDEYHSEAEDDD